MTPCSAGEFELGFAHGRFGFRSPGPHLPPGILPRPKVSTPLIPAPPIKRSRLRRLGPWLVLAALFYLIFARVPLAQVYAAFFMVDLIPFTALAAMFILCLTVLDSLVQWYVFSRRHGPLPWREVFLARGARSFLDSLATAAGQAGMGYWLARRLQLPLAQAASTTFFLLFLEIYSLLVIPFVLLLWLPEFGPRLIWQSSLQAHLFQALTLAWLAFAGALLFWRKSGPNLLQRLADRLGFWSSFHQATLTDFLIVLLGKTLLQAVLLALSLLMLRTAHLELPPRLVFLYFPLITVLAALPITPARLGTTQAGFLLFLQHAADPARLVAFSLLWQFMLNLFRWLLGALFLPRLLRGLPKN